VGVIGSRQERDEGFTLIEVLAAVFIFIAVSAATIAILLLALRTIDQNNERVLAANVARSQVEYLRTLGASNITPGLTYDQPPGTPPGYTVALVSLLIRGKSGLHRAKC